MVGVPCFSTWPFNPRSRTVSPIWSFCNFRMITPPKTMDTISETMIAIAALKVMNSKSPAPGNWSVSSQYLNKWYNI